MTKLSSPSGADSADLAGRALAQHLHEGLRGVDPDIRERLRVARQQALARRKLAASRPCAAPSLSPSAYGHISGVRRWCMGVLPLAALVVGLITIHHWQVEQQSAAIADVDSTLLTDELPPDAYLDAGFKQFILREVSSH